MELTRDNAFYRSVAQRACSVLLTYPDDGFRALIPVLTDSVASLPVDTRMPLEAFVSPLRDHELEELRTHYVETFDMRRRFSPFLTYWTHGDTRNRGMALLHFKQVYRGYGLTTSDEELPDHLAVVLEFAAICTTGAGQELLGEHRAPIELLREALHSVDSPYAHVLDAVVATLMPMTPELAERARSLAASGPPTELVGVGGPVDITISPFPTATQDRQGIRR